MQHLLCKDNQLEYYDQNVDVRPRLEPHRAFVFLEFATIVISILLDDFTIAALVLLRNTALISLVFVHALAHLINILWWQVL